MGLHVSARVVDSVRSSTRCAHLVEPGACDIDLRAMIVREIDDASDFIDVERDHERPEGKRFRCAFTRLGAIILVEMGAAWVAVVALGTRTARASIASGRWELAELAS